MKIDITKFSHLPSELPRQDKSKIKIYIAYKSDVSSYLAYIIYKTLSNSDRFELFYDRACIGGGITWKRALDVHMNQCDIVLIIGQKGAFDSFKLKRYNDDFFIKELMLGYDKNKALWYVPIENYNFWEKDEILAKKRNCKKYGERIKERQLVSLTLDAGMGGMEIFEKRLSALEQEAIDLYDDYLQTYGARQANEELKRQSISEQRREINRIKQL